MPDFDVKEKRFEQDIEEYLLTHGGYQKGNPAAFNREKALDTATFLSFIRTSQPKQWERFEKIYGADSERQLIDRFCREVKLVGLLKYCARVLPTGASSSGPCSGSRRPLSMRPARLSTPPTSSTVPDSSTTP